MKWESILSTTSNKPNKSSSLFAITPPIKTSENPQWPVSPGWSRPATPKTKPMPRISPKITSNFCGTHPKTNNWPMWSKTKLSPWKIALKSWTPGNFDKLDSWLKTKFKKWAKRSSKWWKCPKRERIIMKKSKKKIMSLRKKKFNTWTRKMRTKTLSMWP